uniref:Uncharacterized protein n=1 Tax=Anopheles darlingi TaxID=43151 RepID=A0A2M4D9L0_ANODA
MMMCTIHCASEAVLSAFPCFSALFLFVIGGAAGMTICYDACSIDVITRDGHQSQIFATIKRKLRSFLVRGDVYVSTFLIFPNVACIISFSCCPLCDK